LAIALFVAWLLISVPSYLALNVLEVPLTSLSTHFNHFRSRLFEWARVYLRARKSSVDRFLTDHHHFFSYARDNVKLLRQFGVIRSSITDVPSHLTRLLDSIGTFQKHNAATQITIQRLDWPRPVDAPSPNEYALVQTERTDALFKVITFSFFGILLVSINTLMLSQFFASLIPPIRVLNVPVSLVAAALFSLLEVAFGGGLAFFEGATITSIFARGVLGIAIVFLACIEFGFYAQFGAQFEFDPLSAFWSPDKPPSWTRLWFGVFGPLVVLGMALCGHMIFAAGRVLARDNVVRQYRRFLRWRTQRTDLLGSLLSRALKEMEALGALTKEIEAFLSSSTGHRFDSQSIVDTLERFDVSVRNAQENRSRPYSEVGHSEMIRIYYGYLLLAVSTVLGFLLIAAAFGAFGLGRPIDIGDIKLPGWALALSETVLALGAGYVTGRILSNSHPDEGSARNAAEPLKISGLTLSYAIVVCLIVGNAVIFAVNNTTTTKYSVFALTTSAMLWLMVVGPRLGLVVAAVWAFVEALVNVVCSIVLFNAACVLAIVIAISYLLRVVLGFLAFPVSKMIYRRKNRGAAISTSQRVSALWSGVVSGIFLALLMPAHAQQLLPQEPQSSVTVLVDLSGTWLNPGSLTIDDYVLGIVAKGIEIMAADLNPPIIVRYLPIGDLSFGRPALCQVIFFPRLLRPLKRPSGEVDDLKELWSYLGTSCPQYILTRRRELFTDITSAFNSVAQDTEHQLGAFKGIIVLSDLKEERRATQQPERLHMTGWRVLLLYRILNEDRPNPDALSARIDAWKARLVEAGAQVVALNDLAASPAQISRLLTR
jgi:hypothetical protein